MTTIKIIPLKTKEIRSIDTAKSNGRIIEGYQFKFNTESKLIEGKFYEIIRPGAITNEELRNLDIIQTFNHDENKIPLQRWNKGKGSLFLIVDSTGLYFRFKAKDTETGNEILEAIKNEDITNTSFQFYVEPSGNKISVKDGKTIREITKFSSITDISLVVNPAYVQDTPTVKTRSKEQIKEDNLLDVYYLDYQEIIDNLKQN